MATVDELGNVYYDEGDTSIVGPFGDELFSNDPAPDGTGGFGAPIVDYVNMQVYNGSFPLGPGQGLSTSIGSNNTLPYWSGLHVVSGNSITATWERDSSGTDYNLRFTMAPGAADDEAYVEQIVRIPHSKAFTIAPTMITYCSTAMMGTAGDAVVAITTQYLRADGVTTTGAAGTGSAFLSTVNGRTGNLFTGASYPNTTGAVPLDAAFIRIRLRLLRFNAAATATGSVDITDVRLQRGDVQALVTDDSDPATYGYGSVFQRDGLMWIVPASLTHVGGPNIKLNASSGVITLNPSSTGDVRLPEQAAPSTPASGYYSIYAKTDGILYGKNDAGTEVALGQPGSGVKAKRSATQSLTSAVTEDIHFTAADDWDTDAFHDPSTNPDRITIPADRGGKYLVAAIASFAANTTGVRYISITVNTLDTLSDIATHAEGTGTSNTTIGVTTVLDLAAGDIVRVAARQNSGGALNVEYAEVVLTTLGGFSVSGGGAPTTADYLVGTANGSLSAEIVVGTSPGGELGGTWASPTVDATHSGSAHHNTHAQADVTGLTTADSPQFTAVNVGHATDTTLARVSAGVISVEGNTIYAAGGTDVPVADGGTGASTAAGAASNLGVGTEDSPTFTALTLSDGQLVFPATQVASAGANTLDDYEEGTWTPVLTFATPGDLSVAYTVQAGHYTKSGQAVFWIVQINTSTFTFTTASGALQVTGLPFTVGSRSSVVGGRVTGWTAAGYTVLNSRANLGGTTLDFPIDGSGVATATLNKVHFSSGTNIVLTCSGHYII